MATLGDEQTSATRSIAITILLVGISHLLFVAWFGTMLFLVPLLDRHFMDLKAKLPYVTELTLASSRWTVQFSYVVFGGILLPGLGVSSAISYLVRHRVGSGRLSVIWFGFLFGVPLFGHLLVWMTLFLPLLWPTFS